MTLIDTHTHLFLPQFNVDRELVVHTAIEKGVQKMLLPDIDSSTTGSMLAVAADYPDHCLPMIGLHPTSVRENFLEEISRIRKALPEMKFWGIGETGIDLYWDKTHLDQQIESFRIHIGLAIEFNLPLIIHCRDSFAEITRIIDEENHDQLTGIFHAFTGTPEQAEKIMGYGFKMGIGGIVTFKNSGLDRVVSDIPLEHLVLETDSPYLAPVPFRGKRNESANLVYITEKIAELQGVSVEEVAAATSRNACELFGIEL